MHCAIETGGFEHELHAILGDEPLPASTPHTLTTFAALHEDLERIRHRGFATDDEEHELGVACVATPILDAAGTPLAAISVSGPTPRMQDTAALAALLRTHATDVSTALAA